MTEEIKVDQRFIIELQGKDFIKFEGLLDLAHKMGLTRIETDLVHQDGETYIFNAIASFGDKHYSAHGDATDANVGATTRQHKIRVAETRAVARALRLACNIGMCSAEELGDEHTAAPSADVAAAAPKEKSTQNCSICGDGISEKVYQYSIEHYQKPLCFKCQKTPQQPAEETVK